MRFEIYETIGELFRNVTGNTLELSAADRIWELILDTILETAEIFSADAIELLSAVILFNRLNKINGEFANLLNIFYLCASINKNKRWIS